MDKFNEQNVSAFLTAGGAKLMLLHDGRTDDAIRTFFAEVHELYVKVCYLYLYTAGRESHEIPYTPDRNNGGDTSVSSRAFRKLGVRFWHPLRWGVIELDVVRGMCHFVPTYGVRVCVMCVMEKRCFN